jgi:hypothetical protein
MPMYRYGFLAALVLASQLGCAGRRPMARAELDPCVEWVFDTGWELELAWHLYPVFLPGWISGGAVDGQRVILVCNLGSASEVLKPSRAIVLDLDTARILKNIPGPTQTYHDEWIITAKRGYFRQGLHPDWVAFDLQKDRVDWQPPKPSPAAVLREEHSLPDGGPNLSSGPTGGEFIHERLQRFTWDVGHGRRLTIDPDGRPGGWVTCDLTCKDRQGLSQTRRLCRVPCEPRGGGGYSLLANDDRRLLFSWDDNLICVDTRIADQQR